MSWFHHHMQKYPSNYASALFALVCFLLLWCVVLFVAGFIFCPILWEQTQQVNLNNKLYRKLNLNLYLLLLDVFKLLKLFLIQDFPCWIQNASDNLVSWFSTQQATLCLPFQLLVTITNQFQLFNAVTVCVLIRR